MKRFLLGFALALFVACGDDESSFAARDDEPTSSSWSSEGTIGSSSSVRSSSSVASSSSSVKSSICKIEQQFCKVEFKFLGIIK